MLAHSRCANYSTLRPQGQRQPLGPRPSTSSARDPSPGHQPPADNLPSGARSLPPVGPSGGTALQPVHAHAPALRARDSVLWYNRPARSRIVPGIGHSDRQERGTHEALGPLAHHCGSPGRRRLFHPWHPGRGYERLDRLWHHGRCPGPGQRHHPSHPGLPVLWLHRSHHGPFHARHQCHHWLGIGFYVDGFWAALFGGIIVSIVSWLLSLIFVDD